jgi:hypothetical protein
MRYQADFDPDEVWKTLVAAARQAPSEALPALDAEQVAQTAWGLAVARPQPPLKGDERIVSWAAVFALAASLALMLTYWSDVAAAWSPEPAIFDLPVVLEPVE